MSDFGRAGVTLRFTITSERVGCVGLTLTVAFKCVNAGRAGVTLICAIR
jgi:hypothetical protein